MLADLQGLMDAGFFVRSFWLALTTYVTIRYILIAHVPLSCHAGGDCDLHMMEMHKEPTTAFYKNLVSASELKPRKTQKTALTKH